MQLTTEEDSGSGSASLLSLRVVAQDVGLFFLEVHREDGPPVTVALPVVAQTGGNECRVTVAKQPGAFDVGVALADSYTADVMLEYLESGDLQQATDLVQDAERLLQQKMVDPVEAALGGYVLLRVGDLERLHAWPANLANWFSALPDGAVIAGELAARRKQHDVAIGFLIDGGTTGTAARLKRRLAGIPPANRALELLVVTHIDGDHIAGILKLLVDEPFPLSFGDIWFNGWRHLPQGQLGPLGPVQGETLTDYLVRPSVNWNAGFGEEAVVVGEAGSLPRVALPGGMELTVLSPGHEELATLKPVWEREVRKAGLDPDALRPEEEDGDTRPSGLEVLGASELPDIEALAETVFAEDSSKSNGTSIVLLAEFAGHSVLLTGDAHAEVVAASIDRLLAERGESRLKLDLLKLPHHGSKANTSGDLLNRVDCTDFLVCTNGAYHQHPDEEAISRVIVHGGNAPKLHFNYLSKHSKVWQTPQLMARHGYETVYPAAEGKGLVFELEDMS